MLRCWRDDYRIDVDLTAHDIAHAAFRAFVVGDFQAGHNLFVQGSKVQSFKVSQA